MANRNQATADLRAATTDRHLGAIVTIEGEAVAAVKRSLAIDEAQTFSVDGLLVEGFRLTFDPSVLSITLHVNDNCLVDGVDYTVSQISYPGESVRVTFTRYLA